MPHGLLGALLMMSFKGGKTYYVDATGGSDSNTGLSTVNAWQTLAKVNASTFQPGDQVLLKCGETFKGTPLIVPSSGAAGRPIIFGAYGSGANPIIDPTTEFNDFEVHSGAIWKRTQANAVNILQVFEDGVRLTWKVNVAAMAAGTTTIVSGVVYVWCTDGGDPNTGHVIDYQIPVDGYESAIDHNGKSYLVFDSIDATKGNKHGYRLWNDASPGTDVTVRNCNSSFNGAHGFYSYKCANSLFSHCVANDNMDTGQWIGSAANQIIEYCESYNTGLDVSPYGKLYPDAAHYQDGMLVHGAGTTGAIVRHNYIHDFWSSSTSGECLMLEGPATQQTGTLVYDNIIDATVGGTRAIGFAGVPDSVTIYNNIIRHAGNSTDGFGINAANATNLKIYNNTIIGASGAAHSIQIVAGATITIKNNIIVRAGTTGRYIAIFAAVTGGSVDNNLYYGGTARWLWGPAGEYTVFATWKSDAHSPDAHSPTPADPVFVTAYTDLHLQVTSPCIGAGVDVDVDFDYDGVPQTVPPTIGAYVHV